MGDGIPEAGVVDQAINVDGALGSLTALTAEILDPEARTGICPDAETRQHFIGNCLRSGHIEGKNALKRAHTLAQFVGQHAFDFGASALAAARRCHAQAAHRHQAEDDREYL